MSHSVRLEPAAIQPGAVEQLTVKLTEPSIVTGVKLDDPDAFEVVRVIAGRMRADGPFVSPIDLPISPPNAFVIVLVKSKIEETKVCSGDLLLSGDKPAGAAPPARSAPQPNVVHRARASVTQPGTVGEATFKVDERGWPLGGSNEVYVLLGRGEAERLVQAINGYPITAAERPALLRRFNQALGKIK